MPCSHDHRCGRLLADAIPVAHTPHGGFGENFPEPVLARCSEPLVDGAPDLRGLWMASRAVQSGKELPKDNRIYTLPQRVEQCGNRIVISSGGVIHDMRADGTEENGVNDVAERGHPPPRRWRQHDLGVPRYHGHHGARRWTDRRTPVASCQNLREG